MSIWPLVEQAKEHGPDGPSQAGKQPRTGPPPATPGALVIHTLGFAEPSRPLPEATDDVEHASLEDERPAHTVQLGQDVFDLNRKSLLILRWEYRDVFAFGLEKMPSIAPIIIEHQLNVYPFHRLVV